MSKTVVVLNAVGDDSIQTLGFFGGTLEQAKSRFLEICGILEIEIKKVILEPENNCIRIKLETNDKKNRNVVKTVTTDSYGCGFPPETYYLYEYTVNENDYCPTGSFQGDYTNDEDEEE